LAKRCSLLALKGCSQRATAEFTAIIHLVYELVEKVQRPVDIPDDIDSRRFMQIVQF
jgi:hypothetical protein